jgi:beta-glucosidase
MLRTTFGYKGWELTDWWALPNFSNCAAGLDNEKLPAQTALNAGLDMEMPWSLNFQTLPALVQSATVSQGQLETSATRIVQQQLRFNIATGSGKGLKAATTSYDSGSNSITNNAAHVQLAYQAALESMVLLKNTGNVLPIPSSAKTVAVIAAPPASVPFTLIKGVTSVNSGNVDFANDIRTGDLGSSRAFPDPNQSTSMYAGIKAAAPSGVNVINGTTAAAAMSADFVVVVAGLTPEDEAEDYTVTEHGDRMSFSLDDKNVNYNKMSPVQDPLIESVAALNKPMVVVLEGGSVIDTSKWLASVPAVVMAWYPGQQGGRALGDLIFANKTSGGTSPGAQANFSGKLPVTWSKWTDYPTFSAGPGMTTVMDYYLGYRYFDHSMITPLFPFGAGLSYSTFSYSNLQVPCSTVTTGAVVDVQVDVTNNGTLDGDEVTFLFVSYPNTQVRRSVKELKAFHRETIPAGKTVRITIPLRVEDLKYWDMTSHAWKWENGAVNVMVGGSSAALPLMDSITVQN